MMLPADWEEYLRAAEKQLASRPESSPKKGRPVKKMVSPRQRQALAGTSNAIKAIYGESGRAVTIDPTKVTFTTELGGSCEPDSPHGKATGSRS